MSAEFDRLAPDYEALLKDPIRDWFSPGGDFVSRKLDVLLRLARTLGLDPPSATWLDVGCGKGELLRAGRLHFGRVVGCDVSTEMIASIADLDVSVQPSPTRVTLPDASVDLVTAVCVYHHIAQPDRLQLTRDVHRVLRPGGVFAMIEHNPINPAVQIIVRRTPIDRHAELLTAREARQLLRAAGLDSKRTDYFLLVPQRLYAHGRRLESALSQVPLGGQYVVAGVKPRS